MTEDQLRAIEAQLNNERLPPAPWRWHSYSQYLDDDRGTLHAPCTPSIIAGDVDEVTGQFLAHARADIPALVAEVRRLQRENAVYEAAVALAETCELGCGDYGGNIFDDELLLKYREARMNAEDGA